MHNYAKMYVVLCGMVSDALDELPLLPENAYARWKLENALQTTEEMYIKESEAETQDV